VKQVENSLGISNVYSIESDWLRVSSDAAAFAAKQGWPTAGDRFNFAEAFAAGSRVEGSGAMRRGRSCAVLNLQHGQIDVQTMMAVLSDHSDGRRPQEAFQTILQQGGICVHSNPDGSGGNTAASLVADLCRDGSRLPIYWCGFYSPCLALFLPIFIEGDRPPVLSIGEQQPADDSPWWQFHQLSRLARRDTSAWVPHIRQRWTAIQTVWFATAYELAIEAKKLIDSHQAETAAAMLTEYMTENTRLMLTELKSLLAEMENTPVAAQL
jgi:dipeptidase